MNDHRAANTVVWVHGDGLSPTNPALIAFPDAPAIFVFDDMLLHAYQLSLKRIVFLYECLLELPVDIRRGDVFDHLIAFARENDATRLVTTLSPAPRFRQLVEQLSVEIVVTVLDVPSLVDYDGQPDLRRFSRYWRDVQHAALKPTAPDGTDEFVR